MADEVNKLIAEAEELPTSEEWLKTRAAQLREDLAETATIGEEEKADHTVAKKITNADKIGEEDLVRYNEATVYGLFLDEVVKQKPDEERMVMFLKEVLRRDKTPADLRERALRQYISTRFCRRSTANADQKQLCVMAVRTSFSARSGTRTLFERAGRG
jgi:hypothetical protein